MKVPFIIGADLSKKTIDFASHQQGNHLKVTNDAAGFKEMMKWLNGQTTDISGIRMVMEHTGLYSYSLERFLHKQGIGFSKVPGLAIKRSLGMVRGKTDKLDAKRIARYGFEKNDQLTPTQPVSKSLEQLQMLYSLREKLVKDRASYLARIKELLSATSLKKTDLLIRVQLEVIKTYDHQIRKTETRIRSVIKKEEDIDRNYQLLQSIKGVGEIVAMASIIKTHNFTRFTNARKFACFCGVAPFEHSSGTSIRKKTRVSDLADKRMKTILKMAAWSAIQHDKELREYYLRRTQSGKSSMSTINVVQNKILYRIFAVIKRQTPYYQSKQSPEL